MVLPKINTTPYPQSHICSGIQKFQDFRKYAAFTLHQVTSLCVCVCVCVCMCVCVLCVYSDTQSCPTLCYLTEPVRLLCPWNFPGKILEGVAISCSKGSSQPRDRTHVSCVSCIGRQILQHWATSEAQHPSLGIEKHLQSNTLIFLKQNVLILLLSRKIKIFRNLLSVQVWFHQKNKR